MNIDLPHFAMGMKIQNFQYSLKMVHVIFDLLSSATCAHLIGYQ